MRQLTLTEYVTCPNIPLAPDERDALRRLVPSLSLAPSFDLDDCYDLAPGSHVGAVYLPGLALQIRPKVAIDRLLFMLAYSARMAWRQEQFDLEEHADLVEAVIHGFAYQLRHAFRRGVLQGYRVEGEALATVRGRIRFDDQLRNRYGRLPPVEVRYDDFTEDIEENRLLKAAIARLGRLPIRSAASRRALRAFEGLLAPVRLVHYHPRNLPEITWTRLNERYRPAVQLARLILRSVSFDLGHGAAPAAAFLVDMNALFEDFVVAALRDALQASERTLRQGDAGLRLDEAGGVTLKPDISWWEGGRCTFVGDVKYKRLYSQQVAPNADLYQLLAYAIAADVPGGLLIYARGEREETTATVRHAGKRLEVRALDLNGTPEDILAQVNGVAARVAQMRAGIPALSGR